MCQLRREIFLLAIFHYGFINPMIFSSEAQINKNKSTWSGLPKATAQMVQKLYERPTMGIFTPFDRVTSLSMGTIVEGPGNVVLGKLAKELALLMPDSSSISIYALY
jgi:hypothetical protein